MAYGIAKGFEIHRDWWEMCQQGIYSKTYEIGK